MVSNDKISIITPSYNSEEFIAETIECVINQSYKNWEMIIVDDCSTDKTQEVISQYVEKDNRVKLIINETNSGPAISRNKAILESTGKYIAFLDSDDLWTDFKLKSQLNFMEKHDYKFTYSYYSQITEEGQMIKDIDNLPEKVSYKSTMLSNKIGCLTVMYNKEYFGNILMENIRNRQDYTLWLKLLKKVDYAYCFPEVSAKYRIRKGSISSKKLKLIKYHWHIYRNIEKQSFFKSFYYVLHYITLKLLS